MVTRIFGHIPGYPEGSQFESRAALSQAGVHRPLQAGISGSQKEGADSIVLSGGYEDDEDKGDVILYTGHGGRSLETGRQIGDQPLSRGNLALVRSHMEGLPVRVIRGADHQSPYAPTIGYRYDGLYRVDDYWREVGRSGFYVWRYRLTKISGPISHQGISEEGPQYRTAPRQETRTLRIIRDTEQARRIKALYDYRCQMCGVRLESPAGPYAEAAHIRPLGAPHNGPDSADNILCLCPNHHVLFDYGSIAIDDDFTLLGTEGHLVVHPQHRISREHLRYHREHYRFSGGEQEDNLDME